MKKQTRKRKQEGDVPASRVNEETLRVASFETPIPHQQCKRSLLFL